MKDTEVKRLLYQDSEAFQEGVKVGKGEMIKKLRELKSDYEKDLDAEPRVYEKDIQLCAKISLIEKLILEYEDVDRKR
jgi:hypothetical protein